VQRAQVFAQPQQAPAGRHIWVSSRLRWMTVDPQLPEENEEIIP